MIPWEEIDRGLEASSDASLSLHRRGEEWSIRSQNVELMNSRMAGSERALAELAAAATPSAGADAKRVLVGGLGLGHTAKAALESFPNAQIVIAEISPKVIEWNRGVLAALAEAPLSDPRSELFEGDVLAILQNASSPDAEKFDAVLLDVDNGPEALSRPENDGLYSPKGLNASRVALSPGGVLAVWSAGPSEPFEKRLRQALRAIETHRVAPRAGGRGRARHTVWVAGPALKGR